MIKRSHFRPAFQSLESRRLLAADAAAVAEVAEIVAADVNADGSVTARDALEVINELNAAEVGGELSDLPVPPRVAAILDRLDVDGNGRLTSVDALRIINRINSDRVDLVDSVLRTLPTVGEDVANEVSGSLRDSVRTFVSELNTLRRDVNLPRQAVADVIGEIAEITRDRELSTTERTSAVLERVESIVDLVGLDSTNVENVRRRVRDVLDSLPDSLTDRLNEISPEILQTADRIVDSLEGGLSFSTIGGLLDNLRGLQTNLRFPSMSSVFAFVDLYRETTADRSFSDTELLQLRQSAATVLESAGIGGDLQNRLLDGFERVIRLRF
ncbi:dockerin type I domain-containing protein [Neorhodopirellula pilleata]|uniref:Dockerin type I repeat protein n=1 Tax=Neorhodopirellula pilleata TaxID=2714738 RepID=A0A5C6A0V6_9BACT|nr:dockerin type I domain-containing protein [Neorhodopirellula pilleata]TWT93056.1 Dockerin type I repeat protein [Neorhodopirellula pilleata]